MPGLDLPDDARPPDQERGLAIQEPLFDVETPAANWEHDAAQRALDELYQYARFYKSSKAYVELLKFIGQFRFYSPFNSLLLQIQMPGATFVAPASRWLYKYGRRTKIDARPLVILRPKGPVMFVFDVSATEPEEGAGPLPHEVTHPFEVRGDPIGPKLHRTIENAMRDGVAAIEATAGSQWGGMISNTPPGKTLSFCVKRKPEPVYVKVPLRYVIKLNEDNAVETKFAVVAHELGHLYCGHLGTPNSKWWPDRRGLNSDAEEFEAESVAFLVCQHFALHTSSEKYLADHLDAHEETPAISLECVVKAAGLIEQMAGEHLELRKAKEINSE